MAGTGADRLDKGMKNGRGGMLANGGPAEITAGVGEAQCHVNS